MVGLYIVIGILLFIALILMLPLGVRATFEDNELRIYAKAAFVRIGLYPPKPPKPKKKKKKKKDDKPSEKEKEEPEEKTNLIKEKGVVWLLDLIREAASLAAGMLRDFFKHLKIKTLQISIVYSGEDAEQTAVGYGYHCMTVYPAVSILTGAAKCKSYGVDISPNFQEGDESVYNIDVEVGTRVIWLVGLVLKHGFKALRLLLSLRRGKQLSQTEEFKYFVNKGECNMDHPIGNLMDITMEKIKEMVDVNTIVGNPITAPDGTLIIPVSKVSYGFASGGSDLPTKKENKDCFGGGSGAGITIQPVAFLTVYQGNVRLISVKGGDGLDKIVEMVPDVVDKVKGFIKDRKKKKDSDDDFSEITVDDLDI